MTEAPKRKPPAKPPTPLEKSLGVLGARYPTIDEVAAVRAVMRGTADGGQQRLAMTYMMVELCGVGSAPFAGENTHGASFKAGALATGLVMAQIADAVLMRFPSSDESFPPHSQER